MDCIEFPDGTALEWVRQSLRQGDALAASVLSTSDFLEARFVALVPPGATESLRDFATGGATTAERANTALEEYLAVLQRRGAKTVIIENDLARRGDPAISRSAASVGFIENRIVH
ncbi:MAG: hypothetical protein LC808_42345 [Actinobacteria bacterium]|nr:hypothetical protein [Actinomycetota bacterium]